MKFYGTFGSKYEYSGCYVLIHAKDITDANKKMQKIYSGSYDVYSEPDFSKIKRSYRFGKLRSI